MAAHLTGSSGLAGHDGPSASPAAGGTAGALCWAIRNTCTSTAHTPPGQATGLPQALRRPDLPRSVSLPVPARRIGWRGLRGPVEAQVRFLDLLVSRLGERDRRAYDRESCPLQHLERSHIVTHGAGEQGPHANRFQEQGERSAGDALSPEGPVDPVCDLGIAINDEAGDAADEPSIDGDRTGGRLWQRPDLRHVDIERGAVTGYNAPGSAPGLGAYLWGARSLHAL